MGASRSRGGQARAIRAVPGERESMVVPRGHASAEMPAPPDSAPEFVSVPSRTLFMEETASAANVSDLQSEAKTVVEREEWIRARDQIALIVRSTVAEAMLPLQESLASIVQRLDVLAKAECHDVPAKPERCDVPASTEQQDVPGSMEHYDVLASEPTPPPAPAEDAPPPSATRAAVMLPPPLPQRASIPYVPPPMAPSALTRLGDLASRLRRERGIDVSPMQLAALLLERVAAVLDERVAAELAKNSMLTRAETSSDDDRWS